MRTAADAPAPTGLGGLHRATAVEKRSLTPVVRHVVLRLDSPPFAFRPGQFIQFVLGHRILRQFSIASPPRQLPLLELCVDISPMGKGSRFIEDLQPGAEVTFRGPYGVFTLPEREQRPLEFVAAGAGIAPIRAMIVSALENDSPPPITLTFGNRTPDDILYRDEWRALERRFPAFQFRPVLSQAPPGWDGAQGYVTDVLAARSDLVGRPFFLCGSPAMVDDTRKVLAAKGVPESDIHFEKFY